MVIMTRIGSHGMTDHGWRERVDLAGGPLLWIVLSSLSLSNIVVMHIIVIIVAGVFAHEMSARDVSISSIRTLLFRAPRGRAVLVTKTDVALSFC